jgi:hypothetical protein
VAARAGGSAWTHLAHARALVSAEAAGHALCRRRDAGQAGAVDLLGIGPQARDGQDLLVLLHALLQLPEKHSQPCRRQWVPAMGCLPGRGTHRLRSRSTRTSPRSPTPWRGCLSTQTGTQAENGRQRLARRRRRRPWRVAAGCVVMCCVVLYRAVSCRAAAGVERKAQMQMQMQRREQQRPGARRVGEVLGQRRGAASWWSRGCS